MATILVSTKDMACDEWLHWRKRGIGGSDAATICGINKFKSVFQLWMEKTNRYDQAVDNEPAYWGYVLEPVIRDEFTKRTGLPVVLEQNLLQHERYPYMLANLDGIIRHHPFKGWFVGLRPYKGLKTLNLWHEGNIIGNRKFLVYRQLSPIRILERAKTLRNASAFSVLPCIAWGLIWSYKKPLNEFYRPV